MGTSTQFCKRSYADTLERMALKPSFWVSPRTPTYPLHLMCVLNFSCYLMRLAINIRHPVLKRRKAIDEEQNNIFEEEDAKGGRCDHKLNDRERILYHKHFIDSIQGVRMQDLPYILEMLSQHPNTVPKYNSTRGVWGHAAHEILKFRSA